MGHPNGRPGAQSYRWTDRCSTPSGIHTVVVFNPREETVMNRDQVKGRMKEAMGKVQQKAGKATGSVKEQAKGLGKEIAGKVQKNVGDARNDAENNRVDDRDD